MPGCNCLSTYIKMRDKDNYLWKFTYGLYKTQNSRVNNMMAIVWNESVRVAFNLITIVLITPQPSWPSGDWHSSVHMWPFDLWMKMLKQVEMFLPNLVCHLVILIILRTCPPSWNLVSQIPRGYPSLLVVL